MNDDEISNEEEGRLLEMFHKAALNEFPNPNRVGCPGSDFLRKLALNRRSISVSGPGLTHVARCSPCFQEFAALREQAVKGFRVRLMLIAATIIVGVLGAGLWQSSRFHHLGSDTGRYVAVTLNLKDRSVVRGEGGNPPPKADSLRLTRERLSLTITLPFASETEIYEVQILRELGRPLLAASGQARLENGATLLTVRLDLTQIPSGRYLVGIRRVPLDWTFYPAMID